MKVRIKRTVVNKHPENRVTSPFIMEPHHRQRIGNLQYDDGGIFSKRIFGNLYKCDCGALYGEGFCEECGCRVIDPQRMPDFYIDLCCHVLVKYPDFDSGHRNEDGKWNRKIKMSIDEMESISKYESFMHLEDVERNEEGEVVDRGSVYKIVPFFDENGDAVDATLWKDDEILIGREALKHAGVSEEWLNENMTDVLLVPHTCFRPMIIVNGKPFITPLNKKYSNIIQRVNNVLDMGEMAKERQLYMMSSYHVISALHQEIVDFILNELQDAEYSVLKSEIVSHPISGAVRATVINRHDVHEDVIIIGDTLVETLYPMLYRKYHGDMESINRYLVDHQVVLLVNRPPTINHVSVMCLYPRIASIYPVGHTEDTDFCLQHNYRWCKERNLPNPVPDGFAIDGEEPSKMELNYGDVEQYNQGLKIDPETGEPDGIDIWGVRCVGMNPIMMDAMNMDCDGDVILEVAIYSKGAMKEARGILPSKSYMNYANGTIRNHIIEDFIFAEQCKNADKKE